ncbi:excinuclease ABC subunit UvrB [Peredibacter sp. HCB2-198]|uniref:excinuclease ABC subunit UvrB n=1 Tax=Peredibacter sp. HCB2-198 TaxID=3383025 RepID=UPI0038B58359
MTGKFNLESAFKPMGDQPQAIETIANNFKKNEKFQTLLGVTGSGKTFAMANVIQRLGKKTLILAPNKTLAAQLFAEFKEFFPNNAVEYFVSYYDYYQPEAYVPGSDTYIEKDSAINDEIEKLRHSCTRSLFAREDVIVVASVSCIYGIGAPDEYFSQRIMLLNQDKLDRDEFLRRLVDIQYQRNDTDFHRGTFRVRGDIVEVFPAYEDSQVVRIEFFDDVVDGIFLVDPIRGKVLQPLQRVDIYPKSHYVVGKDKMKSAIANIKIELRERLNELQEQRKLVEEQRLSQRTLLDLEMMEEMGFCPGIENYSRHLAGNKAGDPPYTLLDYFKKDFLLIVDESHVTIPQVGGMYKGDRARKQNLVDYGFRLPSALDNRPLNFPEFETKLDQVLFVSATPANYELEKTNGEYAEQIIRPTGLLDPIIEFKDAKNQVDDMLVEAKKVIANGYRVLITTLTKRLAEELTDFYKGVGMRIKYLHSDIDTLERMEILRDLRLGEFDILVGINLLREGLDIPEVALVGILDADKEGFLRSTRSLIQTIGRAARNSEGRVILYGFKKTPSIEEAMKVTAERRIKQNAYNEKHGLTPKTVAKKVSGGVIEVLRGAKKSDKKTRVKEISEQRLSPEAIDAKIVELKQLMKEAAKDLQFEEAAKLRDEIKKLSELRFML